MSKHEKTEMDETKDCGGQRAPAKARDGEVGYGRPPMHTRFKPGQSGNPKGRPAGRENTKTVMERIINEKVQIRQGGKTRTVSKQEAMLQTQTMKAMTGDARATAIVIDVLTRTGLLSNQKDEAPAALSREDDAIIRDFLRRHAPSAEGECGTENGLEQRP